MFWTDKIAKEIIESGRYTPYWVDDMKTPSGRVHAGSLKGVVIHELIYKSLLAQGQKATFTYCINDMDPMDGFPVYLDREKFYKYMGFPLVKIPSPVTGFASFSQYFAQEFIDVFNKIGCTPKIIWTSQLYAEGKFDGLIKIYLDHTNKIRELFRKQYKSFKEEGYFPYQPICPSCGKIATTRIYRWDGEYVHFICKEDAVNYTKGCGFEGKIKPENQNGKLPWKIEWSAHWKTLGVTIEWSGKDHMTKGGSHEIASTICEEIVHYHTPYAESYEYLLLGGKKMSSSKGLGSSAKEVSDIIPPYLLRFLFTRTDYREATNFDPLGNMTIPDLFDEYDRCWQEYNRGKDDNLSRAFELSQIGELPRKIKKLFLPRFRDIANYVQLPNVNLVQKIEEIKGEKLSDTESELLKERESYARIWIGAYAPKEFRFQMSQQLPQEVSVLSNAQRQYLKEVVDMLQREKSADNLQLALYNKAKDMNLETKLAFAAIYTAVLGRTHGPKAAWFLLQYPKEEIIKRLQETAQFETKKAQEEKKYSMISRPDLFTISKAITDKYPSVSVGIAVIKGVKISKTNPQLEKEKQSFLDSLKGLTTEKIGQYPEIISYRKLYRQMGIDWHSRRPSPEALLRRVVLGKGLYTVNTCVDAYNLTVMKHRVSVGAFDFDQVKFPTVLRFAGNGDTIILLGDNVPTVYTEKELAYYDKEGGYNIDFNYRDAQRTMVTKDSKDLWINVDGIFDISPQQVERSLRESVEMIVKYCGGIVEFEGVVSQ